MRLGSVVVAHATGTARGAIGALDDCVVADALVLRWEGITKVRPTLRLRLVWPGLILSDDEARLTRVDP
eukprot:4994180-Prymnesium_polylepis.1